MTPTEVPTELRPALGADRPALGLYFQALSGRPCSLAAYEPADGPWDHPDGETSVWLPREAPLDDHADFTADEWYQVSITHRALHHALGTFTLDLDAGEPLFDRLRPQPPADDAGASVHRPDPAAGALARVSGLFGHSVLGIQVYATLEDLRIDAAADRILPGLARAACGVRHGALHARPHPTSLAPRAAALEALVRLSLGGAVVLMARALEEPVARIVATARQLTDPRATAGSSVEAALRVCDVLARLPTTGAHRTVHELRFDDLREPPPTSLDVAGLAARMEGLEGFGGWYHPVAYRDWPGPRYVGRAAADLSLADVLPQVAQQTSTSAPGAHSEEDEQPSGGPSGRRDERTPTAPGERGTVPDARPASPWTEDHPGVEDSRLHVRSSNEFVYQEWDAVAGKYRPDFARVTTRSAPMAASAHEHVRALARYGPVVTGLVRSLERITAQARSPERRAHTGDDLDLDACVDALLDLRTGSEPRDDVFTDLRHPRREVSVALALDLSGSTAVSVPPDPLTPGRPRRVLDVQRDAVSLVTRALDRTGDDYGVYAFSGSGREDVRLSVVKDVGERLTRGTWRRLSGLVPDHTTRMGPVIRHLGRRLERAGDATQVLLVISDGRPFDIDYGQQYGDEAILGYAVADVARALEEVAARGVHPFLVTVDPDGADYLRGACDPRWYHVIADVADLPEALAQVYVSVRQDATARGTRPRAAARPAPVD